MKQLNNFPDYQRKVCVFLSCFPPVNLSGSGCDHADGYYLKNADDIISLHPHQQSDTTYNSCNVTVRTDQGRRIEYLIDTIEFVNCGVEIKLLDNTSDAIVSFMPAELVY